MCIRVAEHSTCWQLQSDSGTIWNMSFVSKARPTVLRCCDALAHAEVVLDLEPKKFLS